MEQGKQPPPSRPKRNQSPTATAKTNPLKKLKTTSRSTNWKQKQKDKAKSDVPTKRDLRAYNKPAPIPIHNNSQQHQHPLRPPVFDIHPFSLTKVLDRSDVDRVDMEITPLGAAQHVGKSCIMLRMKHVLVMLDCGMHLGFTDKRRNPDFSEIGDLEQVSAVVITHFHLDHCAALPVLTEQLGYSGPIYMTTPTRAMCKIMLEDYRRVMVNRYGSSDMFTAEMITSCLSKVTCVDYNQVFTLPHNPSILFEMYHAGHVLGAAMVSITSTTEQGQPVSVLYTGDYNMCADRHLAAAKIPQHLPGQQGLCPDVLITESTYCTSIRDSRVLGESDMLGEIHHCVTNGGKVLVPVFALGRVQELCMLLDEYWTRCGLQDIPVYFASMLSEQGTQFYRRFAKWSGVNEGVNSFVFKHVKALTGSENAKKKVLQGDGPMVLFATSAMLEGGMALAAFKLWVGDKRNLVLMPGHCVSGTLGYKLQKGATEVDLIDRKVSNKPVKTKVLCSVRQVTNFSAHTDSKGIIELINIVKPKVVVLVHGEERKMSVISKKITNMFKIPSWCPSLLEPVCVVKSNIASTELRNSLIKSRGKRLPQRRTNKMKKQEN